MDARGSRRHKRKLRSQCSKIGPLSFSPEHINHSHENGREIMIFSLDRWRDLEFLPRRVNLVVHLRFTGVCNPPNQICFGVMHMQSFEFKN
jgi:hypothetical protein